MAGSATASSSSILIPPSSRLAHHPPSSIMSSAAVRAALHARDLQLPHVAAAVSSMLDASAAWTIERAAAAGFKFLVQHLALQRESQTSESLVMDFAARNGHLEILQWLHGNAALGRCSKRAMDDAAKNGHLEIVQWLHANRSEGCTVKAMDYAARGGHVAIVQWLHANRSEGCSTKAMDLAAKHGHVDVLQWLDAHRSEGCTSLALEHAASVGHLDVLRWLCEHREMECAPTAMVKAARSGHVHVLEYLGSRFPDQFEHVGAKMVHAAIANGHVGLMTWLISMLPVKALKREEGGASYSWMDVAAEYGQVGILQWFSEHATELPVGVQIDGHLPACTAEAIEKAAGNGHITVLRFLNAHEMVEIKEEDDAVKALSAAVQGGHRECVQWLLQNFQRYYEAPTASTTIMDAAAASGHVEILQFLRENSTTSGWLTSAKAVNEASRQGLVHVLQWLHDNDTTVEAEAGEANEQQQPQTPLWTPRALEIAAASGRLPAVQWIVAHRSSECRSAEALNAAAYMDHLEIAQFLHANIRSSCVVTQAIEHAEEGGAEDTLAWLQALEAEDRP